MNSKKVQFKKIKTDATTTVACKVHMRECVGKGDSCEKQMKYVFRNGNKPNERNSKR